MLGRAAYDRLLASPDFQAFATKFPLTRPIARRRARALFDLCAGFVYSQILLGVVRTRVLDHVADGPLAAGEIAARCALPPERLARLLDAAVALKLLARHGTLYGPGSLGAALRGNPGLSAMIEHHALLYADLADPVALLRGQTQGQLGTFWPYANGGEGAVAPYGALMAATQPAIAAEILSAYDIARHRTLLDAGGGEGAFLRAAHARAPNLRLMLLDLPPVAARAHARFVDAAVTVDVHGGDLRERMPAGADLVTLVRVLHDHDDDAAARILRAARAALPPGGTLLIAEPMRGGGASGVVADAYFGLYLLAMGSGHCRSPAAIGAMLQAAGFGRARMHATNLPMLVRVMTAAVPARV